MIHGIINIIKQDAYLKFRKNVSNNIYLYILWFYTTRYWRGDNIRLPAPGDDLYFDGYPRSGNTFFAGFLSKVYPTKKFASHLHVVAGLKLALNYRIPIFVIIRNPKDAIVSNLYRKISVLNKPVDDKIIEQLIRRYYNFYYFVNQHSNQINVLCFDSCIKNESLTIQKIAELIGFKAKTDEFMEESLIDFKRRMENLENEKRPESSSLPHESRKLFKNEYLDKVVKSTSYKDAEEIYHDLKKECLKIEN